MSLSREGQQVWATQIAKAKELMEWAKSNPSGSRKDNYIALDPEDFLDLLEGTWCD